MNISTINLPKHSGLFLRLLDCYTIILEDCFKSVNYVHSLVFVLAVTYVNSVDLSLQNITCAIQKIYNIKCTCSFMHT